MDNSFIFKILIADDELEIRETLREIFVEDGFQVTTAENELQVIEEITNGVDLVILDIKLGNDNGIEVLRKIKSRYQHIPVIMITGFGTVSLAKEAFKIGAHDFLEKPLRLLQVRTSIRNALEGVALKKELQRKQSENGPQPLIFSQNMKQLYDRACRLANVKEPVVITGPSGSGKDLLARYLHFEGIRAQGPFVVTNAASMPVTLAEDELFGHERGAFTGAEKKRSGCLEQANGGTLFLDEIGDMDLQVQAKVLRVIETGELMRLGATSTIKVDVRLVCATHKDLESLVRQGLFRHDLWYRISAFVLNVPGLKQRIEDIIPLARHFLKNICTELGINKTFTDSALSRFTELNYPGNVRELKHLIARLAVYTDSTEIDISDIDLQYSGSGSIETDQPLLSSIRQISDFRQAKIEFEKLFLKNALEAHHGNITATARTIGLAQSNLSRKLKELGIQADMETR
ncbi:MAG TPA: sigma-54 dependent transcriptional regulator [Chitinispirillaceae bacterium]|nr:sigma-54 dependent transcriptional regulator [Chitinispirillaceae bacterium]